MPSISIPRRVLSKLLQLLLIGEPVVEELLYDSRNEGIDENDELGEISAVIVDCHSCDYKEK